MIKKLLGLTPQIQEDGSYIPSKLSLILATSKKTNYSKIDVPKKAEKQANKILMVCTEQKNMTMANGKEFSTGNHPVEMLVPMLHLKNAGFDIEIATPSGQPVQIEMWAMPTEDDQVMKIYSEFKEQFDKPKLLSTFVHSTMKDNTDYKAIFIPGGHGAMLGLPKNKDLEKLLVWAHNKNMHTLAICHGPAAFLAMNNNGKKESFLYNGYKMVAFPDSADKQTPKIGYLPGKMPWFFGEKLKNLGVTIVNDKPDDSCHVDRNLITGASPKAADKFGKLCVEELLKKS